MTVRELYREFTAARQRQDDRIEELTFGAYQTVRCWVMTKNKKKMPEFAALLPSKGKAAQGTNELDTALHMLAAQYGGRVRKAKAT